MEKRLPRIAKGGFEFIGDSAQILLLHGYTGSPYDLRFLGERLREHGLHVLAPLLKGHGTKPEDLFAIKAEDWLEQAIDKLSLFNHDRPIIIGGLSMGALLAIMLAAKSSRIDGLVLLSPALHLTTAAELTIFSAKLGLLDKNRSLRKFYGQSDIQDPIARKKTPSYKTMPVAGLVQCSTLQIWARKSLAHIKCPIFLAFGKNDSAIDINASHQAVLERCPGPIFSRIYNQSRHVISIDNDRAQLSADIWDFITNRLGIKPW